MTGYGRGEAGGCGAAFVVEVRSVNHRTLDVVVRLPREYLAFEERLRTLVRRHVARGRCEVSLSVAGPASGARRLFVDLELAVQYYQCLQEIGKRLGVSAAVDAVAVLGLPGVCELQAAAAPLEEHWPLVERAAQAALEELDRARRTEGQALAADLGRRLGRMRGLAAAVAQRWPEAVRAHARRVVERAATLAGEAGAGGAAALEAEAASLVLRADVNEELVRIASHLDRFEAALGEGGPAGRRCDILAQELQREWATVAAKSVDAGVSELAVEARAIAEQLREQAQNLE